MMTKYAVLKTFYGLKVQNATYSKFNCLFFRPKKGWLFPTGILVILSALSKSGHEMTLYMLP